MKKHHVNQLREWFKLHTAAVGVSTTALIVIAGILGLFVIQSRFGPTSPFQTGNGTTVRLQVTDHDTNAQPRLLINSLDDASQTPEYANNYAMEIPRNQNGIIPTLFRIQGNLIYR